MIDGHDSYDLRARLAQLAQEDGNAAEMEKQLCAAKKLDPERSYPYQALAALYKKQGKQAEALGELEHYAYIEQMELAPLKELVLGYEQAKSWAKVRTYGELALYINTQDPEILSALGRAYLELGQGDRALYTYDTMLVINPVPRRPALVHLGRAKAYLAMGKKADARAALALAMKTEPENAEVLELKAKLK
jgi:tetratricopeptide (TPR) repeat protein